MAYFSGKVNLKPVDPDKMKIEKSALLSGAYVFDLELDSAPDHHWILAFEAELHARATCKSLYERANAHLFKRLS
jgi:hypothetical protein